MERSGIIYSLKIYPIIHSYYFFFCLFIKKKTILEYFIEFCLPTIYCCNVAQTKITYILFAKEFLKNMNTFYGILGKC